MRDARRLFRPAGLLLVLLAGAACRSEAPPAGYEVPLLDELHVPDVLVESRRLESPPSTAGNRFVKGWGFRRRQGDLWLMPRAGARLGVVQLEPRPRTLVLRTEIADAPAGAAVRVRAAGRDLGEVPLTSPLEIPLPADLPLGRGAVDLEFPAEAKVLLDQAGLRRALAAGEASFEDGDVVQSGASLVDIVRKLPATATLAGRFVPPPGAGSGQRFAILAGSRQRDDEPAFVWRGGLWSRLRGARDFEIPLTVEDGLVRVRLLATGEGPPGRWQDLRLRLPEPPPAVATAPTLAPPKAVVLYVLDALRADHLGHLGGPEGISPHLDRLAAEGITFTRHLSVAPNTLPSTKSLFTGQAHIAQGGWRMPADGPETLAEILRSAGYRTGVFSGNGYLGESYGTVRGFEHNGRRWIFPGATDAQEGINDNAERVQGAALEWLDEIGPDERVFAYLHSLNPHNPYTPPEPFLERFTGADTAGDASHIDGSTKTLLSIQRHRIKVDAAGQRRLQGLYAGGVAYNDAQIGLLRAQLERRYAPGEVLWIITSDHGDELFEHGSVLHGYTLYDEQLRIPLLLWWPGRLEPARVDAATDNLDLHETLRALVGAPASGRGDGRSLWSLAQSAGVQSAGRGREVWLAAASSIKGGIFMARSERAKLIWAPRTGAGWGQGEGLGRSRDPEYVFDLESDPGETVNLAGDETVEVAWLRSRLRAWIERGRVIEAGGVEEEPEIDAATRANLKALGYVD